MACEQNTWRDIQETLSAAAPNEGCVFVLARPSRGKDRVTVVFREAIWPEPGEVEASPNRLEISADYISRVLDAAIEKGSMTGAILVHTHPSTRYCKGIGRFSPRDDWYEHRLFPCFTQGRNEAISGSIVLGSEPGEIDARIWWSENDGLFMQPVNVVRVVGPEVRFLETQHSEWADHLDPSIMDRSTRLWGREGRRILQNIRVGVVGAGGTGSIVLVSIATMGVGKILAWDKDVLKKDNLHRTLGAKRSMVGLPKVKVLSEYAVTVATADPIDIQGIQDWGTSNEGLRGLKDCDIIFCCVDKFAPRVPLNLLAYIHLIPVIDIASWIHPDPKTRIVDALMTHAHVLSPGIPCAWCSGTLSSRRLTREAQGSQRDAEMRLPYGLSLEETDGEEPSVLPLNLTGAGLALILFIQVALRITERTPRDLKFILPQWELDESDLGNLSECECVKDIALGDTKKIRSVVHG